MKKLIERCPFREGTASRSIYMALCGSKKPLSASEVAKRAKLSEKKALTLLSAYRNPFHNAPLRKAGVQVACKDAEFWLEACAPDPKAKRPERGTAKKTKKPKGKSAMTAAKTDKAPKKPSKKVAKPPSRKKPAAPLDPELPKQETAPAQPATPAPETETEAII